MIDKKREDKMIDKDKNEDKEIRNKWQTDTINFNRKQLKALQKRN